MEDVAEHAARRVEAGQHDRHAEREDLVVGDRARSHVRLQQVGDEVVPDVARLLGPILDELLEVALDLVGRRRLRHRVSAEETAEDRLDPGQHERPVLHRQAEDGEEHLRRVEHGEVDGHVAAALGPQLLDQRDAPLGSQWFEPLDRTGREPRVDDVAAVDVGLAVEVLGEQVQPVVRVAERAEDLVREHRWCLQRLAHVVVAGDHPETIRRRVPDDRRQLAHLVEAGVMPERRPGVPVVDVNDRTMRPRRSFGYRVTIGSFPRTA